MPVSSPAAPGLTSPRALHSRVLQALSTSEDVHRVLSSASRVYCMKSTASRVAFRVSLWLRRGYEVLQPRISSSDMVREVLTLHME